MVILKCGSLGFGWIPEIPGVWIILFIKTQAALLDVILDRYTSQKLRLDHNKTKLTPAKICSIHKNTEIKTIK